MMPLKSIQFNFDRFELTCDDCDGCYHLDKNDWECTADYDDITSFGECRVIEDIIDNIIIEPMASIKINLVGVKDE